MIGSLLDTLLGQENRRSGGPMTGMLVRSARVDAWRRRHRVARLEHVVDALVHMVEVRSALETRGVHPADVAAVSAQLREDVARREDDEPDDEPPFDRAVEELARKALTNGGTSTARFVEAVAATLPAELAFVRRPLAAAASELGATFDAALSSTKSGDLTFDAWDPQLKACAGLMQHIADTYGAWEMAPSTLFLSLLTYKAYFAYFKERGRDPLRILEDFAALPQPSWPVRPRPARLTPAVSASLFALLLRAERYAAEDATDVRLRHLLHALHDEPALAEWIDRLAG